MIEKEEVKVLQNPELEREPIHEKCMGCNRVFENHTLPEGTILVDVCMAFQYPHLKWRNYRVETGKKKVMGKKEETTIFYHYNPCPLATHIEHSPKPVEVWVRVKRK